MIDTHNGVPVRCTIKILKVHKMATHREGEPVVMAFGCDVLVMWSQDGTGMLEPIKGMCVPDPDVAPGRCYYGDLINGVIKNWKIPKRKFA